PYQIYHTLGYLNSRYGTPVASSGNAYGGAPQPASGMSMAFPWLTCNNRPFMNALELTLVPATNQYGLLQNFTMRTTATAPAGGGLEYDNLAFGYPYGHLLTFFQTSTSAAAAPQFSRIFDFVNVPSPYVQ